MYIPERLDTKVGIFKPVLPTHFKIVVHTHTEDLSSTMVNSQILSLLSSTGERHYLRVGSHNFKIFVLVLSVWSWKVPLPMSQPVHLSFTINLGSIFNPNYPFSVGKVIQLFCWCWASICIFTSVVSRQIIEYCCKVCILEYCNYSSRLRLSLTYL